MSEKVQFNMERSLNELHTYIKMQIFSDEELNQIIETRKTHEYQLQRSQKTLIDFLDYIEYEKKLAKIIKKRSKTSNLKYIRNKIIHLFKQAIKFFNNDNVVKMYIDYCMKNEEYGILKDFFVSYFSRYPTNTDFIILAASCCVQFEDYESARILFTKGIRLNHCNKNLYIEFFRMEVLYLDKCKKINEEIGIVDEEFIEDDYILCKAIFDQFVEMFGQCDSINEFCEISKEYTIITNYIES
ncbi:U3 snoRNP protein, partial [Conglomerata obtusa]